MEIKVNEKPTKGIAVDGYCKGNPGPAGYYGVDIETGKILFQWHTTNNCTNNLAEFFGIVHALGFVKKNPQFNCVYSDSEIAMSWVSKKQQGSKFDFSQQNDVKTWVRRCEMFLVEAKRLPDYKKWLTKEWGEIPADPGNKRK